MQVQAIRNLAVATLAATSQAASVKPGSTLSLITNSLSVTPQPHSSLRGALMNQVAQELRSVSVCNLDNSGIDRQQLIRESEEAVAQGTTLPLVLGEGVCTYIREELANPGENVQLLACYGPITTTNESCTRILGGFLAGQLDTEKFGEVCNQSPTAAPTAAPTALQTLG